MAPESSEPVSTNSGDFGAFIASPDLSDSGAILGCEVFLTYFPAFIVVLFPSLDLGAILGLFSSSLGPLINSGDSGTF